MPISNAEYINSILDGGHSNYYKLIKHITNEEFSLLVVFALFATYSSAQIYGGAQVNYNRYLAGTGIGFVGLGLHGDYAVDDHLARISLNFGLPYKEEAVRSLIDLSDGDYVKDIGGTNKYGFITLALDYKFFLGNGDYESGGFFLMAGAGLSMATVTYEVDAYNTSLYTTSIDFTDPKERFFQPLLRAGLGYDVELDFGNVFAEAFANIPANSVSGVGVAINLPLAVGINAGIRIPLN